MKQATDAHHDPDLGPNFWQDAVYSRRLLPEGLGVGGDMEADTAQAPVKRYAGHERFDLTAPALRLDPARATHVSDDPAQGPRVLDGRLLATLLHYSFGLVRHDLGPGSWPFHRTVASARCFYPTELYLILPAVPARPAGVYYYDPMHHQLVLVRPLPSRAEPAPGPLGTAVITSCFGKTAHRYGAYAPRLCAQEAGMVVGSLRLVAAALELHAEAPTEPGRLERAARLCDGVLEPGGEHLMAVVELTDGAAPLLSEGDLAATLRSRSSGGRLFDPLPDPVPRAALDEITRVLAAGAAPEVGAFIAVRGVHGVREGLYRSVPGADRLQLFRGGGVVPALEYIGQSQGRVSMNFRAVALVVYLAVPRRRAVRSHGADAFRLTHLAAGAAAQLISVACAHHDLAARIHNGYEADRAEALFGLSEAGDSVVFQIAVGRAAPRPTFELPVVF